MNETIERRENSGSCGCSALFGIIGRIILMPFVLLITLPGLICHVIVWTFDTTYDHRAAVDTFYDIMRPRK